MYIRQTLVMKSTVCHSHSANIVNLFQILNYFIQFTVIC